MTDREPPARHDVIGLGNAIVDVIAEADERLLERLDLAKGTMTLIDRERMAAALRGAWGRRSRCRAAPAPTPWRRSPRSARAPPMSARCRTISWARCSATTSAPAGVEFRTAAAARAARRPRAAWSWSRRTPSAPWRPISAPASSSGRTTSTRAQVGGAQIVYLEGYLWDRPGAKAACLKAAEIAHRHGRRVALTLSDPFCVDRWRDEFTGADRGPRRHPDRQRGGDLQPVPRRPARARRSRGCAARSRVAALTCSADGSVLVAGERTERIAAAPVARVVDTTGAGDLYAAGLLYGLTHDLPLAACGRLGGLAAAAVLGHLAPGRAAARAAGGGGAVRLRLDRPARSARRLEPEGIRPVDPELRARLPVVHRLLGHVAQRSAHRDRLEDAADQSDRVDLVAVDRQDLVPDLAPLVGGPRRRARPRTALAASSASGVSGGSPAWPLVSWYWPHIGHCSCC